MAKHSGAAARAASVGRDRGNTSFPSRLAALSILAASSLGATDARADEPLPPTPDTNPQIYPRPSARPNLVLVGAAVTAGWYGAAVGTSYLWDQSPGAKSLRYPVVGPYMALGKTGCAAAEEPGCGTFTLVIRTIFTVLSAVGQTGGVLAMGEGIFVRTSSADDPKTERKPPRLRREEAASVTVAPAQFGGDGLGLGVLGRF